MKRFKVFLVLIPLAILLFACSGNISAQLNSSFTLKPGQSALIEGEGLSVKFIQVTADNRCPKNVRCIVAGEVAASVIITAGGSASTLSIVQGPGETVKTTYGGYELTTDVTPYPVVGETIQPGDYRMTFTVRKL